MHTGSPWSLQGFGILNTDGTTGGKTVRIMVVGSGGREHAIVRKLHRDAVRRGDVESLQMYATPGNPGIAELAICIPLEADNLIGLYALAVELHIDLTIVGPEVPLSRGIVDVFEAKGLRIFGPTMSAARLESSKAFAKLEMQKAGVPSPHYNTFRDLHSVMAHLQKHDGPIVVKADGLAAGKGVTVASSRQEAEQAVRQIMLAKTFGDAGDTVILEQYLRGIEMSCMAFIDRSGYALMPPIKDHKSIFDKDEGPNTGGMGTVTPVHAANATVMKAVHERIFGNITDYFRRHKIVYRGVLFAGVIVLNQMAYVIEFNARFGDPETQLALELMDNDLLEVIDAVLEDRVASLDLRWSRDAAVCVVLAAHGYPGTVRRGDVIEGLAEVQAMEHPRPLPEPIVLPVAPAPPDPVGWRKWLGAKPDVAEPLEPERARYSPLIAYPLHAGTALREDGKLITNGGRVINIVGRGPTVAAARAAAYEAVARVKFSGKQFRTDIGERD